ncbi:MULTISPECIES: hypothetical protein [unclassified Carboxylicivirga]|uniref:golvesin C-terminal-like domain-containing protein n=1 Tax=Carboxylicivirga TaxID=1628153 RepID=UPI003D32A5F1
MAGAINAQTVSDRSMESLLDTVLKKWSDPMPHQMHQGIAKLDSFVISRADSCINYYFNKTLSYRPWREATVSGFKKSLQSMQDSLVESYCVQVFSDGQTLESLIPNLFRKSDRIDTARLSKVDSGAKFVTRLEQPVFPQGLDGNHIALWHSHGWYYESKLDRWEWQRARLFGSVEDISPMMYVLPYLVPMLERAGANVFLPRERCLNPREVIVDSDRSTGKSFVQYNNKLKVFRQLGFAYKDTLYPSDNPFLMGSSHLFESGGGKVADFHADIPATGNYAVYVSYKHDRNNSTAVRYVVQHSGGSTSYLLNQSMGGNTWAYLGSHRFEKGREAVVEVHGRGRISVDAMRLGGGMGNVARRPANEVVPNQWSLRSQDDKKVKPAQVNPKQYSWKLSQRPRYMEAARYWLQYAGMPDTLVYSLNEGKNDYNDDYQSRGEWVDYLMGAPNGPTKWRAVKGLGLPIDLSFAFHTDAGVTPNDSVIGTLGIYSAARDSGYFPNGQSKLAGRDLSDIIQTQIVDDIRSLYKDDWTRRGLWDKQYSEAWRPNVPTMLLELLSHQNLADMKYGLDPHFRRDVSRAIYKGILKFMAMQERRDYCVQPLPVDHLAIGETKKGYELTWRPVIDTLEASATPTRYKVYRRVGKAGFDNGTIVNQPFYAIPKLKKGDIVSYKVTAINDGGESSASEVLSVGMARKRSETVLVVNGFDRIAAPAFVDEGDFAGVAWWDDQGVPDQYEYAYTGHQYDFNRQSPWLDDDSPGWGASYGNTEGKVIRGNNFDHVWVHGQAILAAGYSFISVSDEVFEDPEYDASSFKVVDIILGEERSTEVYKGRSPRYKIYTSAFMNKLCALTANKQHVLLSGAYVGSDIYLNKDTAAMDFAADVLRFKWRTNHASQSGNVYASDYALPYLKGQFEFNTEFSEEYYAVEAPDAIEPMGINAITAMRYGENNASAAVLYDGNYKTIVMGFPFETVMGEREREALMKQILNFFYQK